MLHLLAASSTLEGDLSRATLFLTSCCTYRFLSSGLFPNISCRVQLCILLSFPASSEHWQVRCWKVLKCTWKVEYNQEMRYIHRSHNEHLQRAPCFYQIHLFPVHFQKWAKRQLRRQLKSEKSTVRESQPTFHLLISPPSLLFTNLKIRSQPIV